MKKIATSLAAMILTTGCLGTDILAQTPTTGGTSGGSSSATTHGSTAGSSGGTTGGSTSSSQGSGNTGASGSSGNASSGGASSGSTSAGGSTGGSSSAGTGGFICPSGFAYVAGNCIATGCAGTPHLPAGEVCSLVDGGVGTCENSQCLDLGSDPNNCGSLGLLCPSDTSCVKGVCQTSGGDPSACAAGACPAGFFCIDGDCYFDGACAGAPPDATCFATSTSTESGFCCNGTCFSATQESQDPDNCGACGNVCPAGSVCSNSICVPTTCSATSAAGAPCFRPDGGQATDTGGPAAACCAGACVDLTQDPANCGACNAFCASGQSCVLGSCTKACASNTDCGQGAACLGAPGCYPTSCATGSSNTLCAIIVSSSTVVQGACCAGDCTSLMSDPQNCGACGVVCPSGACENGGCLPGPAPTCATAPSQESCVVGTNEGLCCGGSCTFNDDGNCGACGIVCPIGTTCTSVGGTPQCAIDGQPSACTKNSQCATGQVCVAGGTCSSETCGPNSEDEGCGLPDGGPGTCCAGACVDLTSDSQNCQGCGAVCPAGAVCVGANFPDGPLANCFQPGTDNIEYCSSSSVCPTGFICPLDDDACHEFPTSCAALADGASCGFGFSAGAPIFGTCCGGQCVDPSRDPENCGACGLQCPSGACVTSPFGGSLCAPAPVSACTQSCAPGTACLGTTCQSVTCASVFSGFCPAEDGTVGICAATEGGNGFGCVDITSDPLNCGAVGQACPSGQSCSQGICSGTPAPCDNAGQIDAFCNLDGGFGWTCCQGLGCVDLFDDAANCGSCGALCSVGQVCTNGVCG